MKPQPTAAAEPELRLEFEAAAGAVAVRVIRSTVRSLLRDHGFSQEKFEAVELGLDEVLTNACTHGQAAQPGSPIELTLELYSDRLTLCIDDAGSCDFAGTASSLGALPDDDGESGRGMFLIQHTMDEVSFQPREGGGTRVRLVKLR